VNCQRSGDTFIIISCRCCCWCCSKSWSFAALPGQPAHTSSVACTNLLTSCDPCSSTEKVRGNFQILISRKDYNNSKYSLWVLSWDSVWSCNYLCNFWSRCGFIVGKIFHMLETLLKCINRSLIELTHPS